MTRKQGKQDDTIVYITQKIMSVNPRQIGKRKGNK
jgi:hypothetical protein